MRVPPYSQRQRRSRPPRRHAAGGRMGGRPVPPHAFCRRNHPHRRPSAGLCRVARRCPAPRPRWSTAITTCSRPSRWKNGRRPPSSRPAAMATSTPAAPPTTRAGAHPPQKRRGLDHRRGPAADESEVPHRGRGRGRQRRAWRSISPSTPTGWPATAWSSATAASSPPACRRSPTACAASPTTSCA